MRNLSLLSLVLLGASTITAAVMKNKSVKEIGAINSLTLTTGDAIGNELTCVTTWAASQQCDGITTTATSDSDMTSLIDDCCFSTFCNGKGPNSTDAGSCPHRNTSGSPS